MIGGKRGGGTKFVYNRKGVALLDLGLQHKIDSPTSFRSDFFSWFLFLARLYRLRIDGSWGRHC